MPKECYWSNQYIWRKLEAIKYKGGKCLRCGYNQCYAALEFHHRDKNQKEFSWSKMRNRAWHKVLKELDKCDLLCANCHREEHNDPLILNRVVKWRKDVDLRKVRPMICQTCSAEFKPKQNRVKYCSRKCADVAKLDQQTKISWPRDLPDLVANSSKRAVAMMLGVSDKAVAKRLRNHHAAGSSS